MKVIMRVGDTEIRNCDCKKLLGLKIDLDCILKKVSRKVISLTRVTR